MFELTENARRELEGFFESNDRKPIGIFMGNR